MPAAFRLFLVVVVLPCTALADDMESAVVPVNRSTLVELPMPMGEVMVANPDIADVHVDNATHLIIVGKRVGHTTVRLSDKHGKPIRRMEVAVTYDLPAIRHALRDFIPGQAIGVEMVGSGIALTGQAGSAGDVDKAIRIVKEFLHDGGDVPGRMLPKNTDKEPSAGDTPEILNLLQVNSGQQVMLRVRVGEIQRSALKELGIDLNVLERGAQGNLVALGTGGGIASLVAPGSASVPAVNPGVFLLPGGQVPTDVQGVLTGRYQPNGPNGNTVAGLLKALESDG
ncbi:MAG: pilus assembly protein N-terminal domain-containing protein, partial [Pseudomonadota bacterium]|nr:pilus assembly protein N-terminal domain-containing protein [Pseudomonadota bacterium]